MGKRIPTPDRFLRRDTLIAEGGYKEFQQFIQHWSKRSLRKSCFTETFGKCRQVFRSAKWR